MIEALDMITSGRLSLISASNVYGIPKSTLRRKVQQLESPSGISKISSALKNRSPSTPPLGPPSNSSSNSSIKRSHGGLEPLLTPLEEMDMAGVLIKMSRCGKCMTVSELKINVEQFLNGRRKNVFKDSNVPHSGWLARLVFYFTV